MKPVLILEQHIQSPSSCFSWQITKCVLPVDNNYILIQQRRACLQLMQDRPSRPG